VFVAHSPGRTTLVTRLADGSMSRGIGAHVRESSARKAEFIFDSGREKGPFVARSAAPHSS
jgi:hypothetical protein